MYCNGRLNPTVLQQVGIDDGETLQDMLHYFCNSRTTEAVNTPLKQMDALVNRVKDRKEVSISYMITFNHDKEMREEGRADIIGLIKMLKSQGRIDEFDQAMENPSYLENLLEEYYSAIYQEA